MDEDGWFYVVDRKKDMINASGYKVWPREVEDVLYAHPAVREAAVVGVPDEYRGETVKAFVSSPGRRRSTPEELIAFCRERMAAYKYPRVVESSTSCPRRRRARSCAANLDGPDPFKFGLALEAAFARLALGQAARVRLAATCTRDQAEIRHATVT